MRVDWGQNTFDVNDTTEVKITPYPSDASIENLDLSANNIADLDFNDGKAIITFKEEGTSSIFFTANDSINSNTTSITVIDKAMEEKRIEEEKKKEAEKKAEEERIKAEQEAKAKAEEEARIKAEQEAQAKAEEEARIKAEQEAQAKAEEARVKAEQEAQIQENSSSSPTAIPPEQGEMVWISATGDKYHNKPNCGRMNPNKAYQMTRSDAEARGLTACSKCY